MVNGFKSFLVVLLITGVVCGGVFGFWWRFCFLVVLLITGVGRPPLVGGNAGNDTDSSYFCSRPALGQFTGGNPALPLNSQNSIFNLPFP